MKVNKKYGSDKNTYAGNAPQYIVVHNTDNFAAGADALAHAKAQYSGNLSTSVHYYTDDKKTVYQTAPHNKGCWHVGVNYGGRLFGTVNNKNSIGVEMCVQAGYDFNKAFANTVEFVRQLMVETGIPADRVVQHYDVCAKNCPSQIRKKGLWEEFKKQIGSPENSSSATLGGAGQTIKPLSGYVKIFYKGKDGLNIRKAPCMGDNVEQNVFEGTYTVVGISEDDQWYQLKSGLFITAGREFVQFFETVSPANYMVRITISNLRIRKGPGTNYGVQPGFTGKGVFTVVEEANGPGSAGWGLLKAYQKDRDGWISLDYATRV
ncbi:N-acetylmuramoyl-L-alanine amidase [Lacrimispora brassicae]